MNKFLASYIETALWSSNDNDGTPLDSSKYADLELAGETLTIMENDCEEFENRANDLMNAYNSAPDGNPLWARNRETIAHDFWLTRNRHGAGFWDGDYPKPLDQQLTALAHSYGECYLYIGDDGKLYLA